MLTTEDRIALLLGRSVIRAEALQVEAERLNARVQELEQAREEKGEESA